MGRVPRSTHAEAPECPFEAFRRYRDVELRNQLVREHLGLADYLARKFLSPGETMDDLRQVARMALIGAVERFDPQRGVAFATFASRTVEGACRRHLRDLTWAVRPPRRVQEAYLHASAARAELEQELGKTPTAEQIAEHIEEGLDLVVRGLEAGRARSFAPIDLGPDVVTAAITPLDSWSAEIDSAGTPYETVELQLILDSALDQISQRDRELVDLRFVHGCTEQQIADRFGVSQSFVSRRLRWALKELRRRLEGRIDAVSLSV